MADEMPLFMLKCQTMQSRVRPIDGLAIDKMGRRAGVVDRSCSLTARKSKV